MPSESDLRFNWVVVRLATIDADEMRELVLDAWRMVVPKKVIAAYEAASRITFAGMRFRRDIGLAAAEGHVRI